MKCTRASTLRYPCARSLCAIGCDTPRYNHLRKPTILTAAGGCQNSGGRHVNDVHLLAIAGLFTVCGEASAAGIRKRSGQGRGATSAVSGRRFTVAAVMHDMYGHVTPMQQGERVMNDSISVC